MTHALMLDAAIPLTAVLARGLRVDAADGDQCMVMDAHFCFAVFRVQDGVTQLPAENGPFTPPTFHAASLTPPASTPQ